MNRYYKKPQTIFTLMIFIYLLNSQSSPSKNICENYDLLNKNDYTWLLHILYYGAQRSRITLEINHFLMLFEKDISQNTQTIIKRMRNPSLKMHSSFCAIDGSLYNTLLHEAHFYYDQYAMISNNIVDNPHCISQAAHNVNNNMKNNARDVLFFLQYTLLPLLKNVSNIVLRTKSLNDSIVRFAQKSFTQTVNNFISSWGAPVYVALDKGIIEGYTQYSNVMNTINEIKKNFWEIIELHRYKLLCEYYENIMKEYKKRFSEDIILSEINDKNILLPPSEIVNILPETLSNIIADMEK